MACSCATLALGLVSLLGAGTEAFDSGAGEGVQSRPRVQGLRQVGEVMDDLELQRMVDDIAAEVEAIRGRDFKVPVIARYADQASIARLSGERYFGETEPADWRGYESMVKLLGLVPGGIDLRALLAEVVAEQVGSFYDRDEHTLLLDDSQAPELAQGRIVHELARALDDQHFEFDRLYAELEGSSDRFTALQSVIEGSAWATTLEWRNRNREELDLKALQLATVQRSSEAIESAPPLVWKPLFAYVHRGYTFLCRSSIVSLMVHGVRLGDVERAYEDLPESSEQILHPVKYWKSRRVDRPRDVRCRIDLPEGWGLLREDTLGELTVALLTEPFSQRGGMHGAGWQDPGRVRFTNEAADGWGGDRVVLLEHGEGVLLRGSFRWDRPVDAQEFFEAMLSLQTEMNESLADVPRPEDNPHFGLQVTRGAESDEVLLTAWVGLDRARRREGIEALRFHEVFRD